MLEITRFSGPRPFPPPTASTVSTKLPAGHSGADAVKVAVVGSVVKSIVSVMVTEVRGLALATGDSHTLAMPATTRAARMSDTRPFIAASTQSENGRAEQ